MAPVTTVCLLLAVLCALSAHAQRFPPVLQQPSSGSVSATSTNQKAIVDNGDTQGNNDNVIVIGSSGPSRDGASVAGHNQENGNAYQSSSSISL